MSDRRLLLESELNELEAILSQIPQENVIERISLDARLKSVQDELCQLKEVAQGSKVLLTFRGKPVSGSHGIAADFAAKATAGFADAFAAVAAALGQNLSDLGPIPQKGKNQLMITGTAVGSFGFQFELPADGNQSELDLDPGPAEYAMAKVEALLRLSAEEADDELAEVIGEVHPRAVRKVHEFMNILVQNRAWCGLEFEGRKFRFRDYQQLKLSAERLRDDNIKEQDIELEGQFVGFLPASRSFEFSTGDAAEDIIRGKVSAKIDEPDVINQCWLYKKARVKFSVIQVGTGRPRYTLLSLSDIRTD